MFEMSSLSSNGQPSTRSRQANSGDRTTAQLSDIRQKHLSHVLYWRFFVNLALMLIDAAMYIIAGATVLNLRHEATPFYSSRFNFTIDSTVYFMIVACFWVWSLYVAGIYHRHVMGDGYQLNVLLVKGMVVCWVVQCAFSYFFNLGLTLTSLCLVVIAGWLLTMVERIASRAFITRSRRKGAYAYGTVIIGSPHGIGRTLKFLGQRRQLNYRPVAVCPIHLNPDTGLIEQSTDHETLREEMQKNEGCQLPVLEYSDHNLAEQIIDMNAQTVMVADELHRYSDNYDIFSVRMESFGLEIAVLASAADTSNHEIQVRSIQGTTIITQRLAQYTPARRMAKRLFDLAISSLADHLFVDYHHPGGDRHQSHGWRTGVLQADPYGPARQAVPDVQVPFDGGERRRAQEGARKRDRPDRPLHLQDEERPTHHQGGALHSPLLH